MGIAYQGDMSTSSTFFRPYRRINRRVQLISEARLGLLSQFARPWAHRGVHERSADSHINRWAASTVHSLHIAHLEPFPEPAVAGGVAVNIAFCAHLLPVTVGTEPFRIAMHRSACSVVKPISQLVFTRG